MNEREYSFPPEIKNSFGQDLTSMYLQYVLFYPEASSANWERLAATLPKPKSVEQHMADLIKRVKDQSLQVFIKQPPGYLPVRLSADATSIKLANFTFEYPMQRNQSEILSKIVLPAQGHYELNVHNKTTHESYRRQHLSQTLFSVAACWAELNEYEAINGSILLLDNERHLQPNWASLLSSARSPKLFRPGYYPVSFTDFDPKTGTVTVRRDLTQTINHPPTQQELQIKLDTLIGK